MKLAFARQDRKYYNRLIFWLCRASRCPGCGLLTHVFSTSKRPTDTCCVHTKEHVQGARKNGRRLHIEPSPTFAEARVSEKASDYHFHRSVPSLDVVQLNMDRQRTFHVLTSLTFHVLTSLILISGKHVENHSLGDLPSLSISYQQYQTIAPG